MSVYESDIRDYKKWLARRRMALFKTIRIALIRKQIGVNNADDDKLIKSYFGNSQIVFMGKKEYQAAISKNPRSLDGKAAVTITKGRAPEETYVDIHQLAGYIS